MSQSRNVNMAKIAANVEDDYLEDENSPGMVGSDDTDTHLSVDDKIQAEKLKQAELKSQMAINRLEKAKDAATSDEVKKKLQEEIDATKQRKAEQIEARKTQLAEAAKRTKTVKTATDLASTSAKVASDIKGNIDKTRDKVNDTVGHVAGTLEQVSTPGTLWLPITLLLVFFFLLLPVNGQTRAQWLWMSLIGDAKIQPSGTNNQDTGSGQGGGGGSSDEPLTYKRVY